MMAIAFGHVPLAIVGLLIVGLPPIESTGFIVASALLHCGYQIFLMHAYRYGDLSQIYPIARGLAPLLLTIATFFIGQDVLTKPDIIGITLISGALIAFGFTQFIQSSKGSLGLLFACITGCFIASYSMVDAIGARISMNPVSFFGMMTVFNSLLTAIYFAIFHKYAFKKLLTNGKKLFWVGGNASYIAYVLVLWACLHAPVAVISSLRETSVLFAMFLGIVFLRERLSITKISASIFIFLGIVLMRLPLA